MHEWIRTTYYILTILTFLGFSFKDSDYSKYVWLMMIPIVVDFIRGKIPKSDLSNEEFKVVLRMQPNLTCSIQSFHEFQGLAFDCGGQFKGDMKYEGIQWTHVMDCLVNKGYVFERGTNCRLFNLTHKGQKAKASWLNRLTGREKHK